MASVFVDVPGLFLVRLGGLTEVSVTESVYYTTTYGTPLAYVRTLELYSRLADGDLAGRRVLDFGYGTIEQLWLMALRGADGFDQDSGAIPYSPARFSRPLSTAWVSSRCRQ